MSDLDFLLIIFLGLSTMCYAVKWWMVTQDNILHKQKIASLEQQLADKCHLLESALVGNAKMKHNIEAVKI